MPVRVRFAPSPTGFLHIGGVRTALFNWLFARHEGGEFLLRVENTDASREVAESVEQIQRSLRWLGLDWDGDVAFQLDRLERHRERRGRGSLPRGRPTRTRAPFACVRPTRGRPPGTTSVKGRIEVANESVEDFVLLRSDRTPTYNFAAPLDDADSGITHVVRGEDHVSNTPKQILLLEALGAELPRYAHVPNVFGTDGRKLSKRHGAVSVEEFRAAGLRRARAHELPRAPRLELRRPDDDHVPGRARRAVQARPRGREPGHVRLRQARVDERRLPARPAARRVRGLRSSSYLEEQGSSWDPALVRRAAPLVQEKITTLGEFPRFAGFLFEDVQPAAELLDGSAPVLREAREALARTEPFSRERIEEELRALCERLGLKPRQAFQPIRVAVTGSKVSPGLFESLELLGREQSLARLDAALRRRSPRGLLSPRPVEDEAARKQREAGRPHGPGGQDGPGREEERAAGDEHGGDDRRDGRALAPAGFGRSGSTEPSEPTLTVVPSSARKRARRTRKRIPRHSGRSGSTSSASPASSA